MCVFDDKLDFALTQGSSKGLVAHSVVRKRVQLRLSERDSVEVWSFFPKTITMVHHAALCDPRLLNKVSLNREPSIVFCSEIPMHHKCHVTLLSCPP